MVTAVTVTFFRKNVGGMRENEYLCPPNIE